jgi:hypothetical protein
MNHTINATQTAGTAPASLIEEPAPGYSEGHRDNSDPVRTTTDRPTTGQVEAAGSAGAPALTYDSRRITIAPSVVTISAAFPATP